MTEVISVTLIVTLLSRGGRFSVELFSFFLIFFFFFFDIVSSLPSKDTQRVTGERFIAQPYKVKPRPTAESETFPPYKSGAGEESDYL